MTDFVFDERAAQGAVNFFERLLIHSKGEWAGLPFKLDEWQINDVIKPLFGWKKPDGRRRYATAYIEVPRKNGKSTIGAGLALYLLHADGEPGAEVYSAAADREQASIVFEEAKAMTLASPVLTRRSEVYKRSIVVKGERSAYKVLSADAFTKHGLNPSAVVFDELHAQPNRDLWDVLKTGMGARRQPLMIAITTAGYDRNSICWELHEYATGVLSGLIDDPSFFAYIAAADPEDDWQSPDTWKKANPGLGVTVKPEYLEQEARRAALTPAYENTFKRLHLNIWTQQQTRWLQLEAWDACAGEDIDAEDLGGRTCYAGLDLASTTDIAALVLVFPDGEDPEKYVITTNFWIPGDNVMEKVRRDKVPYDVWVRQGWVTATEGNVIDYKSIEIKIDELARRFDIKELAFDRWGSTELIQRLQDAGMNVIPFGQGFASMSPPTKELLNLILARRIQHGGNPVLRWMAGNLVVRQDPAGNIKPDKAKSTARIDGMVAMIMAMDRAARKDDTTDEIYSDGGLLTL